MIQQKQWNKQGILKPTNAVLKFLMLYIVPAYQSKTFCGKENIAVNSHYSCGPVCIRKHVLGCRTDLITRHVPCVIIISPSIDIFVCVFLNNCFSVFFNHAVMWCNLVFNILFQSPLWLFRNYLIYLAFKQHH